MTKSFLGTIIGGAIALSLVKGIMQKNKKKKKHHIFDGLDLKWD